MAQPPTTLSPKEPLTDAEGRPTRSWWRFFNSLSGLSGSLANPVIIPPNSIFTSGEINSGSTITVANSPPHTLLGNGTNVAAQPVPVQIDASLAFPGGKLAVASLPVQTLSGNPGFAAAPPSPITLGPGLTFNGSELDVITTSGSGLALAQTIATWGM